MKDNIYEILESYSINNHLSITEMIQILEKCIFNTWEEIYGAGYALSLRLEKNGVFLYRKVNVVSRVVDIKTEIRGANVGETIEEKLSIENLLSQNNILHTTDAIQREIKLFNKQKEFDEFIGKKGELFTCTVKKMSGKSIILLIHGLYEGIIPHFQAVSREIFTPGEKITCRLHDVKSSFDYQLIFERKSQDFVKEILKSMIPEVEAKAINVIKIVRDPGYASMILVSSESSINPVGACIGFKGQRKKDISTELKGERVYFVAYNDNLYKQIQGCFPNVELKKVNFLNENEIEIVVNSENLSEVIGRKGQTISLVSKLISKRISVLDNEQYKEKQIQKKKEKIEEFAVFGIEENEAHNLLTNYQSLSEALNDDTLSEDLVKKIQSYIDNNNNLELEKYVNAGGDKSFFLSISGVPCYAYFILLEYNITNLDSLLALTQETEELEAIRSAKDLYEMTSIDEDSCVLIMNYLEEISST
jgi:transcription termination factor NusA